MKDTYLNAKLVASDLLRLVVFSSLPWQPIEPMLVTDGIPGAKMKPTRLNTLSTMAIADFRLEAPLELGHSYFLVMPQYGRIPVDVNEAPSFPEFDERYRYDGDDLGAVYHKKKTVFTIWAPLASRAVLSYRKKGESEFTPVAMTRERTGVYRATVLGDCNLAEYHYFITNSEVTNRVTDPYAKGSTCNGEESVVVDFERLNPHMCRDGLPILDSYCDAVIYEAHVRDMTISPDTDIVHKGRFLGMVEQGRKTRKGNPAGFDHIKNLGVTHVQLLPIYDYKTVDERHPETGYNWGYDPAQYFVPEGSYASKLEDPLSRIEDCKTMVRQFHKNGIRVVMDVVFNHVYEYENSVFEKVVPNYYFRHKASGMMANTSGCGDDLASERPMVRKLIIDACRHWIDHYGIDGFRFDLMGIVDVETLLQIEAMARSRVKDFILYGEGWNMGGEVKVPLGHMGNYKLMPHYGHFNDFFRESIKRIFIEDRSAVSDVKNVLCGSCLDFFVGAKFSSAEQTINYIECHDNMTFFDFVSARRGDLSVEQRLEVVEAATKSVLFALGVPFLHMGQEVGLSKFGEDNTYNKGDRYNAFDYNVLDERKEMADRIRDAILLRRKLRPLHIFDPRVIGNCLNVYDVWEVLRLSFEDKNLIAPRAGLEILVNPSAREYTCSFPREAIVLSGNGVLRQFEDKCEYVMPPRSVAIIASDEKIENH